MRFFLKGGAVGVIGVVARYYAPVFLFVLPLSSGMAVFHIIHGVVSWGFKGSRNGFFNSEVDSLHFPFSVSTFDFETCK